MKPLPIKKPTLLQTTRCNSCTTYIDGICNNKDGDIQENTIYGRKFKPDNTCKWHSSENSHLVEMRGGVYKKPAFTKDEQLEVRDMFILDMMTTGEIAKKMGVTWDRVYHYTKDLIKERKLLKKMEAVAC